MTTPRRIEALLDDRSYHIEFNGHLTNHAKHAVVALAGLGADPRRIEAYYENYARQTPYGYGLEAPRLSKHAITEESWERFLGKRTSFSAYCEMFDHAERDLGTGGLLSRYLPRLLPGWLGAFTHATIHLGWALDANHRWMMIEGLAYMAFSYVTCHPERALPTPGGRVGDERAVDSLLRIAGAWEDDHDALQRWVEALLADTASSEAQEMHPELSRSGLQYRIARLAARGHPLIYDTPSWIGEQGAATSWEQLYHAVTLLYLAEPGDFVLLHLITSLHAMEQIARRLPAHQERVAIRCFWVGMLCILFSRADFPRRSRLADLHAIYEDAFDPVERPPEGEGWGSIIARAIEEEEEHNPKLVYVMHRMWKRTGGRSIYRAAATRFTTTPELPRSFEEPPNE